MRTKGLIFFAVAALIGAPVTSKAASITYDFAGTVTSGSGIYSDVAVGTPINGTYTFVFSNAVASQSFGTIGSQSGWYVQAYGGSGDGLPLPSGLVFYSTAQADGVSYATAAPAAFESSSIVQGYDNGLGFEAMETQQADNTGANLSRSVFSFQNSASSGAAYSSEGLPLLGANLAIEFSEFETETQGDFSTISYTVNTVSPISTVPLPATGWLVLGGLGGLGALARRKRGS